VKSDDGSLIPRWTRARKGGDETIRISRTVVRQVMDSKQAVLSEDATSQFTDISQSIADLRIRSMMCAPLLDSEGTALGVIQLDTLDQRKQFRKDDLEVLASVASRRGSRSTTPNCTRARCGRRISNRIWNWRRRCKRRSCRKVRRC
jgi:phosphoserine phosphatase RsbU/P